MQAVQPLLSCCVQPTWTQLNRSSTNQHVDLFFLFLRHDPREVAHCQKAESQEHSLDFVLRIAMFLSSRETGEEKKINVRSILGRKLSRYEAQSSFWRPAPSNYLIEYEI